MRGLTMKNLGLSKELGRRTVTSTMNRVSEPDKARAEDGNKADTDSATKRIGLIGILLSLKIHAYFPGFAFSVRAPRVFVTDNSLIDFTETVADTYPSTVSLMNFRHITIYMYLFSSAKPRPQLHFSESARCDEWNTNALVQSPHAKTVCAT
ncbi:hypothetical protein RB195_016501 [Necator americanus]|uniref:Uncharacterized protein n=1 Tax=Necator americanus TaxID=51031 RepID=A0ABR1C0R3_NECAM